MEVNSKFKLVGQFTFVLFICGIVLGCKMLESITPSKSNNQNVAVNTPAPIQNSPTLAPTVQTAEKKGENLLSLSTGAFVVKASSQHDEKSPFYLINDNDNNYAAIISKSGDTSGEYVIALPEKTELETLSFWGHNAPGDSETAKDVAVQMSDTSADAGFETILEATLNNPPLREEQSFPVSKKMAGRWLKVILKTNHGSTDSISLAEIRGYGKRLTQTPIPDVTGTYKVGMYFDIAEDTNIYLKQTGVSVEGCVAFNGVGTNGKAVVQLLSGGGMANNALLLFTQKKIDREGKITESNPTFFVFSPDHQKFFSRIITDIKEPDNPFNQAETLGKKISNEIGECPQWTAKKSTLADELEKSGRVTFYGINFDTDSDVIKAESFPTLDKIVQVAKERPDWKFGIEGHTDSVAEDAYNQKLSERRANAVKAYLVKAGIAEDKFEAVGLGETKPIGDNKTETGRAQNRRVELVKK